MHDMSEALLLRLLTLLDDLVLLRVGLLQLLFDLVQSDDVKRLLTVSPTHQNVGKLVMVLELSPKVVHNLVTPITVQERLMLLDDGHHLFPKESIG